MLLALISSLSHPPYIIIIFSVSLEVVMSSSSAEPRARSRRQPPRSTMNRNCRPPEIQLVNNWYSRRSEGERVSERRAGVSSSFLVSHQRTGLVTSLWSAVASQNKHNIRSKHGRNLPIPGTPLWVARGCENAAGKLSRGGNSRDQFHQTKCDP